MGDETDDMVQTTFEKAQQSLHSFEVGPGLRKWLMTILVNSCIDQKRKGGLRPVIDSDSDYGKSLFENPAFVATPADPYEYTETKMLSEQLQAVLSTLSPEHLDVLREVAFGSMKYEEFANSRGIPVGTVRSRLSKARSNAQQLLINAGVVTIDPATGQAHMTNVE